MHLGRPEDSGVLGAGRVGPSPLLEDEIGQAVAAAEQRHNASWRRRAVDLVVSVPLAVLTFPVVVVLALISAVAFRAWPFFVQERVGRDGRSFRFVKIRSLPVDVPSYLDKYALHHRMDHPWSGLIRRSHLDELPQLWHVVAGQMSLVGPRPEMVPLSHRLDAGFARARVMVRPGCTGLWQLSVHNAGLIGETPKYDLYYLSHSSIRLDLWVLWRTLRRTITDDHIVALTDVPVRFCGIDPVDHARYTTLHLGPAWRARPDLDALASRPHDGRSQPVAELDRAVVHAMRGGS
jgi:lipopolysaccharide/colanic/teichoic acid biosynthesis glycosyltransferase